MDWALKIWNGLMFMLCRLVYLFIKWLYQVFEAVAKANLFTEEVFDELTGRIYLIMGIAMLFIFAYNLVLMIINPDDKKGTGAMSKVVKETIISLIAVVLLPTIFNYMYTFQNHVVSSNILGQLILGGTGTGVQDPSECDEGDYECKCDFSFLSSGGAEITTECENYRNLTSSKRGANLVPATIFSAFYRPANFTLNECANHLANNTDSITGDDHDICVDYYTSYQMSKYTGKISYLIDNDDLKDGIYEDPQLMEFDHIFALGAGLLGAWMFLCYAMEIGVRVFKLGVLQLISPIPVMMRVVPGQKEKMYDKWFKELLNTYLDVFIRLIIIFFALFAVSLVPEMIETLWSSIADGDSNAFVKLLAMVIVILGILKFAQEAPELLKTFFGSGGKFSLRSPKKQFNENKLAKGAVGYVGGAGMGLASSIIRKRNPISGFFKGGANAAKNMYNADLMKKDAFLHTMRDSKYQTDYEQNHSKFQAIKRAGGLGGYIKEQGKEFYEFLGDANSQSEKVGAANALFANSARVNELVVKDVVNGEKDAKAAFEAYKDLYLGADYYKRNAEDGNWYDKNGKAYSRPEMEKHMKDYYRDAKVAALTAALTDNKKDERDTLKKWTEAFNKSLVENFPKLGDEVGQKVFKTIQSEGGIEVKSMEDLISKMDNFQSNSDWENVAKLKFATEKAFKDAKEGAYDFKGEQKKS